MAGSDPAHTGPVAEPSIENTGLAWLVWKFLSLIVIIDVVKSLHGCDRESIFNVVSQLRSMEIPITSIWKQELAMTYGSYVTLRTGKTVETPAYVNILHMEGIHVD